MHYSIISGNFPLWAEQLRIFLKNPFHSPSVVVFDKADGIGKIACIEIRQTALGQVAGFSYTENMMNGQAPFRIIFSDCETVIRQVTENLEAAGLRVVRSFDLRSACASFTDNVCPHHGSAPCDCQLVVLLIYGVTLTPVSLILHSHRKQTELQWDEAPDARPSPEWQAFFLKAMDGKADLPLYLDEESYAATV